MSWPTLALAGILFAAVLGSAGVASQVIEAQASLARPIQGTALACPAAVQRP